MGLFTTPRFKPHNHTQTRTQDSVSTTFRRNVSAADIATFKSDIESNFPGVGVNYIGNEFDYHVVVEGPNVQYAKAINFAFPKGRDDIVIDPFQTLP